MLNIIPVEGYFAKGRFINLPFSVYAKDPCWVPPLKLERRLHLSRHNPYFEHATWCAWMAYRGKRAVGRISAQIDNLEAPGNAGQTAAFGLLDAQDDAEVFAGLFDAAESWLKSHDVRKIRGPFSLSINDECGLLIDGFNTPPSIMMGHARPYYRAHVENLGYRKAIDTVAYRMHPNYTMTPTMEKIVERSTRARKGQLTIRSLDRTRLYAEMDILRDIFNDAWQDNWGFVPFTQAEFRELGTTLKFLVDDEYITIGEIDGEPAGFIVCLPNINEAIADINGRLFPTGWLKLLSRVKFSHPNTARVPLMGIRKKFQSGLTGSGISLALIKTIKEATVKRGVSEIEMGWILEDNKSMRNIIEQLGGVVAKRYRVYEKILGDNDR